MDFYKRLSEWTVDPSPILSPDQVVRIQLDALQNNDLTTDNAGIRLAFKFASPANQSYTGPVERFIRLVKTPPYGDMIGFSRAEISPALYFDNRAQLRVALFDGKGSYSSYVFTLSRQEEAPYEDCWLTDGVMPE